MCRFFLCCLRFGLFSYFAKWLASRTVSKWCLCQGVSLHKDQLLQDPLTFKQNSSYELFWFFIIFSVPFSLLVVHYHHDHSVTTVSKHCSSMAWYSLFVLKVPLNTNQPCHLLLLLTCHCDYVTCSQEVETEQFYSYFQPELKKHGYAGVFSAKSRARTMSEQERKHVDGCAIFYKMSKYVHCWLLTLLCSDSVFNRFYNFIVHAEIHIWCAVKKLPLTHPHEVENLSGCALHPSNHSHFVVADEA